MLTDSKTLPRGKNATTETPMIPAIATPLKRTTLLKMFGLATLAQLAAYGNGWVSSRLKTVYSNALHTDFACPC